MMRRTVQAVVAVGTVLAGLVVGPAPAAADDEVRLRIAGRFTAGGPPGQVTVEVVRDDDDCVSVSMLLEVVLPGAGEADVQVAVENNGRFDRLRMSSTGPGRFVTEPVFPDRRRVCEGDRTRVLLQVGLGAAVAADEITLVGRAFTESGELMDATDESRPVRAGRGVASPTPTSTPTPVATGAATPPLDPTPAGSEGGVVGQPPGAQPSAVATEPQAGSLRSRSLPMGLGLGAALVGLGVLLLVLLVRRNRRAAAGLPAVPGQTLLGSHALRLVARHRRSNAGIRGGGPERRG